MSLPARFASVRPSFVPVDRNVEPPEPEDCDSNPAHRRRHTDHLTAHRISCPATCPSKTKESAPQDHEGQSRPTRTQRSKRSGAEDLRPGNQGGSQRQRGPRPNEQGSCASRPCRAPLGAVDRRRYRHASKYHAARCWYPSAPKARHPAGVQGHSNLMEPRWNGERQRGMRTATRIPVAVVVVGLLLGACSGSAAKTVNGPWELRSAVDSTTSVVPLRVFVGSSSCERLDGVDAVESADSVTITAKIHQAKAESCTADMQLRAVELTLSEPLGDRPLLGCGERPGYQGETRDCRAFPSP